VPLCLHETATLTVAVPPLQNPIVYYTDRRRDDGPSGRVGRPALGVFTCGDMRHGQLIGATDRLGGEATDRPVRFGEVFATLYHQLGIDVNKVTVPDLSGRPQFLVEPGCQPMEEMVG